MTLSEYGVSCIPTMSSCSCFSFTSLSRATGAAGPMSADAAAAPGPGGDAGGRPTMSGYCLDGFTDLLLADSVDGPVYTRPVDTVRSDTCVSTIH
jgi:hypothetical protein